MSEPLLPMGGAVNEGYARLSEFGSGMIALRCDLGQAAAAAALGALGLDLPAPNRATVSGARQALWMAPDELLLLMPRDGLAGDLARLETALAGQHHLLADVSDARALYRLEGAAAREVLAKLTPADLAPAAFPPGTARRTRLAQAAALLWRAPAGAGGAAEDTICIACARSQARYVFEVIATVSTPGAEVGWR